MNEVIKKNIPVKLNIAKTIDFLHIEEREDKESLLYLIDEAKNIVNAKAVYKESSVKEINNSIVLIDDIYFESSLLARNLDGLRRVFPFVISAGMELDKWAKDIKGILHQYWAEKIQELLLQEALTYIFNEIEENYQLDKMSTMNPGSLKEWSIEDQRKLFKLISNVNKKIGVSLTDKYVMRPAKSLSGIRFENDFSYSNCKLCNRADCSDRRAEYDKNLYQDRYLSK
ncbi:vitamin B12 dependent-methionine synthase activation domain-containing protein [Natronospora cellulosivora (SeqCode)]